jgi:hypothetical protein
MKISRIDPEYFSPIQSAIFKQAAGKFNSAVDELNKARLLESKEQLEALIQVANEDQKEQGTKINPLYYSIIDRAGIVLDHIEELLQNYPTTY